MHRVVLSAFAAASLSVPSIARAQSCPANVPHLTGTWVTLPYGMPINPISATLLRSGKVLIIAGSENDASNNGPGAESYRAAVWDPAGTTASSITVQGLTYDVFCSGTSLLPDGRALVVGGTSDYSFRGDARASIFDPVTERFLQSQSMADGRWYGTATTLGDGRVVAFSGLGHSGGTNSTVEIYDLRNAGAGWSSPVAAPFTPPLYPRMALLPNGTVFYTGQGSGTNSARGWIFDPAAQHLLRRRQPCDEHDGDHRPLGRLAGLDRRSEHVHRAHPDERGAAPQRQGARRGWVGQQREPRRARQARRPVRPGHQQHDVRRDRFVFAPLPFDRDASGRRNGGEPGQQPRIARQLPTRRRDLHAAVFVRRK